MGHAAQYGKSAGTLLGAEPIVVKDAVEQVAPKSATFRIPGGERQVFEPGPEVGESGHVRLLRWEQVIRVRDPAAGEQADRRPSPAK